MQCFFKALCYAATKLTSEIGNAFARHFTPLSPWRGAGGEAYLPSFLPIFCWCYAERLFESVVETRSVLEATAFGNILDGKFVFRFEQQLGLLHL